jgi:hypothetical protein
VYRYDEGLLKQRLDVEGKMAAISAHLEHAKEQAARAKEDQAGGYSPNVDKLLAMLEGQMQELEGDVQEATEKAKAAANTASESAKKKQGGGARRRAFEVEEEEEEEEYDEYDEREYHHHNHQRQRGGGGGGMSPWEMMMGPGGGGFTGEVSFDMGEGGSSVPPPPPIGAEKPEVAAAAAAAAAATQAQQQHEAQHHRRRGGGLDVLTEDVSRVWSSNLVAPRMGGGGLTTSASFLSMGGDGGQQQQQQRQRMPRSFEQVQAAEEALDAEFAEALSDPNQALPTSQRLANWSMGWRPGLPVTEGRPRTGLARTERAHYAAGDRERGGGGGGVGGSGGGGGGGGGGGFSKEAIEAAARAAVEAALAAANVGGHGGGGGGGGASFRLSPPLHASSRHSRRSRSPSPYDSNGRRSHGGGGGGGGISPEAAAAVRAANTRATADFFSGGVGEAGRSRLVQAKSAIESMSGYPPAVFKAMRKKKKGATAAAGAKKAPRGPSRAAVEERQARALAALQGQVEQLTTSRRSRVAMSSLKSYFG